MHRMTKPEIIMKDWSELTDEDMERIANSGYEPDSHEKLWFDQDKAYTSLYFMNMKLPDNAMEDAVSRLMSDSKCAKLGPGGRAHGTDDGVRPQVLGLAFGIDKLDGVPAPALAQGAPRAFTALAAAWAAMSSTSSAALTASTTPRRSRCWLPARECRSRRRTTRRAVCAAASFP